MSEFQGVDFFQLDDLLTDEERQIRDAVREFVDRELIDSRQIELHHRAGTFPMELPKKLGELGYLGPTIQGYGCLGVNSVSYGLIMQELERGDSGIRSFCSVQSSLCMFPIYTFGTQEQKDRYLPGMAKGEIIGCFGLSEPDHGSDPSGMETKATPDGKGGWVLNGTKRWITNGSIAHIAIVWAKTPDGIRGFIVPTNTKGFSAPYIEGKFSLRASVTSELIMEDCHVGPDALLPGTGGLKSPLMCLSQARYGIVWGVVGSAMAVFDEALRYTKQRSQFDKPLAGFQLVQEKLVWMHTELTKAQLVSWRLGRMKDEGKAKPHHVSFGKRNNCWVARECAKLGRELLGANGVCDEYQVMRHLMNIESVYTYEGTHDIHTLVLGEHLTGLPAYR